ncbi:hypothetical protein [Natrinema pallidum]|uniref:Uncharacterized protein n=1 Tax=Natrinema pallidum TaxID=69527 RepID=A0A4P9TLY7_9EURY|nr:hypothetical protein [Natrinema pallidum]QCW05222.1 hypothetical protein FGF80_18400 [Natrinema pallidum]
MSTKPPARKKATDDSTESQDIVLIDESTIRRLEDEQSDEHGCRFAAVARTFEQKSTPNATFSLPSTRVAYVDESGEFAIEREFFGHREDWHEIPRTVVVTDSSVVSKLPDHHTARYAPILEMYRRVLAEE